MWFGNIVFVAFVFVGFQAFLKRYLVAKYYSIQRIIETYSYISKLNISNLVTKKNEKHTQSLLLSRVRVCVCVYGWVGGCACVFILFHREDFFPLQDVCDILEGYGSTMFFVSIMSYFTSEDETPACRLTGEKIWYDIIRASAKMIYYDIGYKSATL